MPSFNVLSLLKTRKSSRSSSKGKESTTKKYKKCIQNLNESQIKLSIELPYPNFELTDNDEEDYAQSFRIRNKSCESSTRSRYAKNINPTINLKISFDGVMYKPAVVKSSSKKCTKVTVDKNSSVLSTSGYFSTDQKESSMDSSVNYDLNSSQCCADTETTTTESYFTEKPSKVTMRKVKRAEKFEITKFSENEDHHYDKLGYSKRRHSLCSTTSSSTLSLSSSNFSVSPLSTNITKVTETSNDYEEISNFTQVTSTPAKNASVIYSSNESECYETLYNFRSSSVKKIRRLNDSKSVAVDQANESFNLIRKREYSVNDIFQTLELVKSQVKEQEKVHARSKSIVSQRNELLKASARNRIYANVPQFQPIQIHDYVNDRISKTITV